MRKPFAKLFDTGEADMGQILVLHQGGEGNKPEVRTFVQPTGLGVCSIASIWLDNDAGWAASQVMFDNYGYIQAVETAKHIIALGVQKDECTCPSVACSVHGLPPGSASGGW